MKKLVGGDDVHRQPDRPAGAAQPRRRRPAERRVVVHRRAQVDPGRPPPGVRAPARVRLLDGRQHHPLPRPREDDDGRSSRSSRAPSPRPSTCPKRSPSRRSSSCTSRRGGSASKPWRSTATTARSASRSRWRRRRAPPPTRRRGRTGHRGRRADRREDRHRQGAGPPEAPPVPHLPHLRVPGGRLQGLRQRRRVRGRRPG